MRPLRKFQENMAYKVVILPPAKRNLKRYIQYTSVVLHNKEAAAAIRNDALSTKERLSEIADVLPFCTDPLLKQLGYRKISFRKHDFFMVYRIVGNIVLVESMYHELQDYESAFTESLKNSDQKENES